MKKFDYAWVICGGCTLLLFCTMGLTTSAFTVYQPYIISEGGLTNAQGSFIITTRSLFALTATFFVNRYHQKIGIRLGVAAAAAAAALSFFLYGISTSFISYCLAASVAGVSYGLGGMVPASVIIERWFKKNKAFALGICGAGSGAASIVVPPVVTLLIKRTSLSTAFAAESVFILAVSLLLFAVIRSYPENKEEDGYTHNNVYEKPVEGNRASLAIGKNMIMMAAAIMMIGAIANPGYTHLAVLYKSSGFDSVTVSLILSFAGIVLTPAKCAYGYFTDRLGTYKSGIIFFLFLTAGLALCCFSKTGGLPAAYGAMACLGLGLPLATVGLSFFARDLSAAENYEATVRSFQLAYMLGGLGFGPIPGLIADKTGSYIPAYYILTFFSIFSMVLVIRTLKISTGIHK